MTTALEGGEGSASRPGRSLPPGKTQYPLYRMLGGPQGRSGEVRKISLPPGFDPRTVQPVGSRYTDYTTRPAVHTHTHTHTHTHIYIYVPGLDPRRGDIFHTRPDRPKGPPVFLYRVPFQRVEWPGRCLDHVTNSSTTFVYRLTYTSTVCLPFVPSYHV